MGKRSKNIERMLAMMEQRINAASQPNQWETAIGNEITRRNAMSNDQIRTENLGPLADWQRRYNAGTTPESSVRSKAYGMQLGKMRDLGAQELARDYGRMGEQSVQNYRNQTLAMMGGAQQTAAQRMWNAVNATGQNAMMWNQYKPGGGWFEGLQKAIGLGKDIMGMIFGGGMG